MTELFPVTAGVIVGLALYRCSMPKLRLPMLVVLSIVLGLTASAISGRARARPGLHSGRCRRSARRRAGHRGSRRAVGAQGVALALEPVLTRRVGER